MQRDNPFFSIVTVCRNAAAVLGPTIASVRQQSFRDFEYIVIDGASTDNTGDLVRAAGDLVTTFVSEPDRGIYDAMNKSLRLARGQWIYFLNANDFFPQPDVLARVAESLDRDREAMLAYGDVLERTGDRETLLRFDWLRRWNLRCEHLCHQAVFVQRGLFDRIGSFDLRYRINADYDWLLKAFGAGTRTIYLGFPVASFDTGGVSAISGEAGAAERRLVRARHKPPLPDLSREWFYRAKRKLRRLAGLNPYGGSTKLDATGGLRA